MLPRCCFLYEINDPKRPETINIYKLYLCLTEMFLMTGNTICFRGEVRIFILDLSANKHPLWTSGKYFKHNYQVRLYTLKRRSTFQSHNCFASTACEPLVHYFPDKYFGLECRWTGFLNLDYQLHWS